ncbi:uncharacterized protein LOC131998151 [Stomoxys calcitrans]|uniref:uncharacterized protein LOC131995290 n=1 Tax=Stomoxys calcitrans TaxID=35570 RepID=UPI0027E2BC2B|nr:uncharacterized protein LOC131995290 [Stomoxys calcitrans]XP_059226465.1 uncharacterized protein LOC131998151 [Stomoxys calcitrans]
MPSIKCKVSKGRRTKFSFNCRLCKGNHGLRKCQKFLCMTVDKRLHAVIANNYCPNCLAHTHSSGKCFSSLGCKHCGGSHHSYLHIHSEKHDNQKTEAKDNYQKPKRSTTTQHKRPTTTTISQAVSLETLTSPHTTNLFPTAVVDVLHGKKKHSVRAVIDPCTSISKISQRLIEKIGLTTTTLGSETICPVAIHSKCITNRLLETMMTVNHRISMDTPKRSIPATTADKFPNMKLADPQFYQSGPFDIVFGSDLYAKIILPGLLPSNAGLPVATNTIFGWVLSGSCSA